ncbi:MAG TPA: hypothetical protein VNC12_00410, partial [Solirubrobacteraceae bacterium]|nr:hypothetical protein [Solirubrobacteraceae bacterium]
GRAGEGERQPGDRKDRREHHAGPEQRARSRGRITSSLTAEFHGLHPGSQRARRNAKMFRPAAIFFRRCGEISDQHVRWWVNPPVADAEAVC